MKKLIILVSILLFVSCNREDSLNDIFFMPDDHCIPEKMAECYARYFIKQFLGEELNANTRGLSTNHESFTINNERLKTNGP